MPEIATSIVEDVVQERQETANGETVKEFTEGVKEEVQERTEVLTATFGDAAKDIVGPAMEKATSYSEEFNTLLDPNAKVDKKAGDMGAAGFTNMGDRTVTYDTSMMDMNPSDPGYLERLKKHEFVHQTMQAGAYNAQQVTYVDATGNIDTVEVHGDLTEWQAIDYANIPSDLTAGYKKHHAEGEKLAEAVGEDRVKEALGNGDMQGLQQEIIEEQLPEMLEAQQINVTVGADV